MRLLDSPNRGSVPILSLVRSGFFRQVDDSSLTGAGAEAALRGEGNTFIIEDLDYERDVPRTELVRYEVDLHQRSFSKRSQTEPRRRPS